MSQDQKKTSEEDHYSKALLRMGRVSPESLPLQNAQMIRVDRLQSNPRNPRLMFNPSSLQELGDSMLNLGVIEPLVVRYVGGPDRMYEIVVGERRWRAAKQVNIPELPCMVRELDDVQAFELALSENILREELTSIDEAKSYQHMIDMGMAKSLRDIARKVGVSHTRIQQKMNLLELEREFQRLLATRVANGEATQLTEGHARHILRLSGLKDRREICKLILDNHWSTRQTAAEVARRLKAVEHSPESETESPSAPRTGRRPPRPFSRPLSPKTAVQRGHQGELDIHIEYDHPDALIQELESLLQLARSGKLAAASKSPVAELLTATPPETHETASKRS